MLGSNAAASAASEANFNANTAGDPAALCSATPDNGVGTAALNFCEGYLQGAVTVEMQNMAAFRGKKLFFVPDPPPTRARAMSQFAGWVQAAPERANEQATDALFRFLMERYPVSVKESRRPPSEPAPFAKSPRFFDRTARGIA